MPASTTHSSESMELPDLYSEMSERELIDNGAWLVFNSKAVGDAAKSLILAQQSSHTDFSDDEDVAERIQYATLVGYGCGILGALVVHLLFQRLYKKNNLSIKFRILEMLLTIGKEVGDLVALAPIPIPNVGKKFLSIIIADLCSILFGLFAIPYWLIRQSIFKIFKDHESPHTKVGSDGWSFYTKTALIFGKNIGSAFEYSLHTNNPNKKDIAVAGSIGAVTGFVLSALAVPLINYFTSGKLTFKSRYNVELITLKDFKSNKNQPNFTYFLINDPDNGSWIFLKKDGTGNVTSLNIEKIELIRSALLKIQNKKLNLLYFEEREYLIEQVLKYEKKLLFDKFRCNYPRTGIVIGLAIGTILGYVIGCFLPVLGPMLGMTVGGAFCSIIGGTYYLVNGAKKTAQTNKEGGVTDNNWDFTSRSLAGLCACIGTGVGLFIPIPGGVLLGSAIGSAIGWFIGSKCPSKAREVAPKEQKATTIPWTTRLDTGSRVGMVLGGLIGFLGGCMGGPLGMIAGATLGSAIGGFIGGVIGALCEKEARDVVWEVIKSPFKSKKFKTSSADEYIDKPIAKPFTLENDVEESKASTPISRYSSTNNYFLNNPFGGPPPLKATKSTSHLIKRDPTENRLIRSRSMDTGLHIFAKRNTRTALLPSASDTFDHTNHTITL